MSIVGKIENLDHEIRVKEIEALQERRAELVKLMSVDGEFVERNQS